MPLHDRPAALPACPSCSHAAAPAGPPGPGSPGARPRRGAALSTAAVRRSGPCAGRGPHGGGAASGRRWRGCRHRPEHCGGAPGRAGKSAVKPSAGLRSVARCLVTHCAVCGHPLHCCRRIPSTAQRCWALTCSAAARPASALSRCVPRVCFSESQMWFSHAPSGAAYAFLPAPSCPDVLPCPPPPCCRRWLLMRRRASRLRGPTACPP